MASPVLHVGDRVIDKWGYRGVVVEIYLGHSVEDHGSVSVWQQDRTGYGVDNCEHYCEYGWWTTLIVLKRACECYG